MCEYEGKEDETFDELAKKAFRTVDKEDLYYDEEDYDAATEVFGTNVDLDDLEATGD